MYGYYWEKVTCWSLQGVKELKTICKDIIYNLFLIHFTNFTIGQNIFFSYNSSDYGTKTCAGYPGTIDHIQQDMDVS